MRELKFRVYWIHPESDSSGFDYFDVLDGYPQGDPCQEITSVDRYTGMKDRNGKEIYENDICRVNGWRGSVYNSLVEYREVMGSDDMGTNMLGFPMMDEYGPPEVIGNIHENPGLLEAR